MVADAPIESDNRLSLRSQLADMAKLPAWIEGLASRHAIPLDLQLAMNLCLEEVLTNVICHGYRSQADRSVVVQFTAPREAYFVFAVEDEAPRFNPLAAPELPAVSAHESGRIGGEGLRLLRRFADKLEYEPTAKGNRLRMVFSAASKDRSD
jgi:anti-sigma regulatory factor (Ser/Thr protein kinase)